MEAVGLLEIIDHVLAQEAVDIVCADLVLVVPVNSSERRPWLETLLLRELHALLLDNRFVFADCLEELEHFKPSACRKR